MTFDFFEGPAGTGKTHNLVSHASQLVQEGVLGEDRRILALTFMNGARRRLEARLGQNSLFRRRFECQTFDVFARVVSSRLRSLLSANNHILEHAATLDEFDGPCFKAASLLAIPAVSRWVAASYPLVLVDEAQDLDDHRLHILQGLASSCSIVAAADAFQCLTDGQDTSGVMGWLEGMGQTHRLTQPMRTAQQGLLAAARAIREGRDIKATLTKSQRSQNPTWYGPGFRLTQTHAKAGLVARAISDEMSYLTGQIAILTPDASSPLLREALNKVQIRIWSRKNGQTIGPFPFEWDKRDDERANTLLGIVQLPPTSDYGGVCAALAPIASEAPIAHAISRMDRLRRVRGQIEFSQSEIKNFVYEAIRNQSRVGFRQHQRNLAMTIHRAKNREFHNVVVLWPHTAAGSPEQLRRLLYNAITRSVRHCSVIVLGGGRLTASPFAPHAAP